MFSAALSHCYLVCHVCAGFGHKMGALGDGPFDYSRAKASRTAAAPGKMTVAP